MKILALDLGTKTGVACNWEVKGVPFPATTLRLARAGEVAEWGKSRADRRCDPRIIRLFSYLSALPVPDCVAFEDVEFSSYTKQDQLWSSFRTVVWMAFSGRAVIECVPVTTLKKFATGAGNATKEQMKEAMCKRFAFPRLLELDDNAVDAFWVLKWAESRLGRMPL